MTDSFDDFDIFPTAGIPEPKVYRDIPLGLRRSTDRREDVPERIRDMKALAYTQEAYWKTSAWLFRQQGIFMADYTDDQPFGEEFTAYYPTYRDLGTEQLRGYFSWRTRVRSGEYPEAPQAFALMYAYELINLIGTPSPEAAFMSLKALADNCTENAELQKHVRKWLTDLAAYHQLPQELLADLPDMLFDKAVLTLMNWDKAPEDELCTAVLRLSAYQAESSQMYQAEPELFRKAVYRTYCALSDYFAKHRKKTLADRLFGKMIKIRHRIFESAVFFDTSPRRDLVYMADPLHILECHGGEWSCCKLYGNRGRNKPLGEIVRTVDSLLREKTGKLHKLAPGEISASSAKLAKNAIDSLVSEEKAAQVREIHIDLSALDAIRSASELTREKLIVDEETDDLPPAMPVQNSSPAQECLLSAHEEAFLKSLLYRGNWRGTAAGCGILPSMIADTVNEKLFDIFGDTVIEFDGEIPAIIEDYAAELKEKYPEE